jgi:hypothetical protein
MDDMQESSSIPSTQARNDTEGFRLFALLGATMNASVTDPNELRAWDSFLMNLSLDEKHFSTNYPREFVKETVASPQRLRLPENISLCLDAEVGNYNKSSPALISEVHDNSRSKLAPININNVHTKDTKLPLKLKCLSESLRRKAFDRIDKACGFSELNEQHIRFQILQRKRQKDLLFHTQHGRIRPKEYQYMHLGVDCIPDTAPKLAPDRITDEV